MLKKLCATTLLAVAATSAYSAPDIPFTEIDRIQRTDNHFTQGLEISGNRWFESSGRYGHSWLAEYTDPGAKAIQRKWLAGDRFAEGLTLANGKLYLLTWKAGEVFVYDSTSLKLLDTLHYEGEGWGLAFDGEHLIKSNGSDKLVFHDPEDFSVIKTLQVRDGFRKWDRLNELEFAHGLVWANVWYDSRILAIDPDNGQVVGIVDLKDYAPTSLSDPGIANGIAWDRNRNGLWVTGKYWPTIYLIRPEGLGFQKTTDTD
ncbi:glutaminyl-peptide cyclotransferase [Biformimicrobium ophioploci]|uniref:Glutaminyl-peptide cyclotransferase n=1 Tax=Biformimicrobium ophioploci TaxID=3036711 RepID=A0ABQ6LY42_9GAMM|nr:glutaminyl-peptide cyclotransferase [Microbulbifer sp. NKW57]GMG86991.1 glutaminyl-peptide cyclotransferase [Microbulbifer sp. NKW57]